MQTETSNEYETYVQEVAIYEKNFFFSKIFSNCWEDLST